MSGKNIWVACVLLNAALLNAQTDPGPQPGPPNAGRPLPGLTPSENAIFQEGARRFREIDSVAGTEPGAPGRGLGPRFNFNSCSGCHAQPSVGGSSPMLNPQVALAARYGAKNTVPSFVQAGGPIRVARFVKDAAGNPDGGVQSLFTIAGRNDAGTCTAAQPDFAGALAENNVVFRIPTPVYGAGLIEAIPDGAIVAGISVNAPLKAALGISGRANRSGNDGSVTRFGWKAQTRSLEIFSGEAYNVEIGVTNDVFPSERDNSPACSLNPLPEDQTDFTAATPVLGMSDTAAFTAFMRWLAPPGPPQMNPNAGRGRQVFDQIGCSMCHTPVMNTGPNRSPSLDRKPVPLFSDLLVHNMGAELADGVMQGNAAGNEFRTAPLWGLGQRIYFLHDGRTSDLVEAIRAHASTGSEANAVVANFNSLPTDAQQDLLNFLRSL